MSQVVTLFKERGIASTAMIDLEIEDIELSKIDKASDGDTIKLKALIKTVHNGSSKALIQNPYDELSNKNLVNISILTTSDKLLPIGTVITLEGIISVGNVGMAL